MTGAAGVVEPTSADRGRWEQRRQQVYVRHDETPREPKIGSGNQVEHEPDEEVPPKFGSRGPSGERRIVPEAADEILERHRGRPPGARRSAEIPWTDVGLFDQHANRVKASGKGGPTCGTRLLHCDRDTGAGGRAGRPGGAYVPGAARHGRGRTERATA